MSRGLFACVLLLFSHVLPARDFENNYAVYGAGSEPCGLYLEAMSKGGKEQDYFIDWTIGYLSAFNVIMPNTYNLLGETDFPTSQRWLQRHCQRYPKELYINAMIKLTEVLYPMRYQSSLKNPPATVNKKSKAAKPAAKDRDISKSVK